MGWVVNDTARPLYPRKETWYPLYRRLGGPQRWSGEVWKILPPLVFDSQTAQPVGSHYTDNATQPHQVYNIDYYYVLYY